MDEACPADDPTNWSQLPRSDAEHHRRTVRPDADADVVHSDTVHPEAHADPVAAVLAAHEAGARLSLATSGTSARTGRRVLRSTASWWTTFAAYSDLTGVTGGARLWTPGPTASTMVLFARTHAAAVGASVVDEPGAATHACLTPARLAADMAALPEGTVVTVAGAALGPALLADAARRGLDVRHYYGAAELSFVAAGRSEQGLRVFPGAELSVRAADGGRPEVAAGGEIWVRSPWVCDGYDGPPGSLRRAADGWATVGDFGVLDGEVLRVLGRPDAVTTGGATVRVADVEAVLLARARAPLAVHGIPHPTLGEVVAVTLTDPADRALLQPYARQALPAVQRPRVWRVVEGLPLTAAGKVDRARLAADGAR